MAAGGGDGGDVGGGVAGGQPAAVLAAAGHPVLGGILLGPSALGRNKRFLDNVFPKEILTVLDTLSNIGVLFFLFLVGLELDIGRDRKVLNEEAFAILVLMALVTTFMTSPAVTAVYKPERRQVSYKHLMVERADADSELRVLACFHASRGIPTLINLVEASRGTRRSKLTRYAMHLVELSERSSAISMVQRARRNGLPFSSWRGHDGGGEVVVAFEAFQRLSALTVKPMTAISDLDTIHDDIVASALDMRAAIILLPFHKMLCHDGTLEFVDRAFHQVNVRVLRDAPCSVAVLVDRALGSATQVSAPDVSYSILLLFFGGADDREALAYASRMAEHPGIALTVARFTGTAKPSAADEEVIQKHISNVPKAGDGSFKYEEVAAQDRQEMVSAIKTVGRGKKLVVAGRSAPVATPEFSTTASMLVVQQNDSRGDPSSSHSGREATVEESVVPIRPSSSSPDKTAATSRQLAEP